MEHSWILSQRTFKNDVYDAIGNLNIAVVFDLQWWLLDCMHLSVTHEAVHQIEYIFPYVNFKEF